MLIVPTTQAPIISYDAQAVIPLTHRHVTQLIADYSAHISSRFEVLNTAPVHVTWPK